MTGRSVHSLCRSIVVPLLEAGLGIEHVADHLGHKNSQNTQIYAQITPSLRQEVVAKPARHPKIVRLPADVGPRVVQLPFPAFQG